MIKIIQPTSKDTSHDIHDYFSNFKGEIIRSTEITAQDYTNKRVAIIGTDQASISYLDSICSVAQHVEIFQNQPQYILPKTEKVLQRLINHPLFIKNRKLFTQRIKSLVALRFLETEVKNLWLKRQLMPNTASIPPKFLKSDHYYTALQRENCQLITWPIKKILSNSILSIDGIIHPVDVIITTKL